jgi:hypothetical protein
MAICGVQKLPGERPTQQIQSNVPKRLHIVPARLLLLFHRRERRVTRSPGQALTLNQRYSLFPCVRPCL